jgi:CheY-like chemotaxis protein
MSDIVDLVAAIVWPVIILGFLWYFRKPIRTQLLPRITGFQGFGVQLTFAAQALTAATDKRPDISDSSRSAAVARLQREGHVLNGTRILWVDDTPSNNFNERRLFERAGAIIDPALSTTEALKATHLHPYDLIISDWKRGKEENAGPDLVKALRAHSNRTPVVFYAGYVEGRQRGEAIGLTNRPDELLHIVLDALQAERRRGNAE